jgi:hypothetical protein
MSDLLISITPSLHSQTIREGSFYDLGCLSVLVILPVLFTDEVAK